MKAITVSRVAKLEEQFGTDGKPRILLALCLAGNEIALDDATCIKILDETGFLRTGPIVMVNLRSMPVGLDKKQTEAFLRENAAEVCDLSRMIRR